jgi:uncharacterized SAM-binding protein YcdF (DUF218 family)
VFFTLSKILDLVFAPLSWALVLMLAAGWAARAGCARRARSLGLAAGLLVYLPATGFCARGLMLYVERFDAPPLQPSVAYDAVILLGGFAHRGPDGKIELADAADRLLRAWELLQTGRAARVVVAGGSEAALIAELLQGWGVARERMLLDHKSRNTRENALETRAIVERAKLRRLALVTSAFHMQRSVECMRAVGLRVDVLATDHQAPVMASWFDYIAPRAAHLAQSERALRELSGRLVYRMRGFAR